MRRNVRVALIATALVSSALTAPSAARAGDIWSEDCDLLAQDAFDVDESVCVQGELDDGCPGIFVGAAANVYVVPRGAGPFSCARPDLCPVQIVTLGGAGGFAGELVWEGPLIPGEYDIVVDEDCDGIWGGPNDFRRDSVFTVRDPAGPLMCEFPPLGYAPRDPGLTPPALCRGACGPDCPPTCTTVAGPTTCNDSDTEHVLCSYETGLSCGGHAGCSIHDMCYDACGTPAAIHPCKQECDTGCLLGWGFRNCGSWMFGNGPYQRQIVFLDPPPAQTGPLAGACP